MRCSVPCNTCLLVKPYQPRIFSSLVNESIPKVFVEVWGVFRNTFTCIYIWFLHAMTSILKSNILWCLVYFFPANSARSHKHLKSKSHKQRFLLYHKDRRHKVNQKKNSLLILPLNPLWSPLTIPTSSPLLLTIFCRCHKPIFCAQEVHCWPFIYRFHIFFLDKCIWWMIPWRNCFCCPYFFSQKTKICNSL